MADITVRDFHVHIYFEPAEVDWAKALAAEVQRRFGVAVGHFHLKPVGPHPRGSVQLTVPTDRFGEVATFLGVARGGLTIFAHASTGDDMADHTENVVWFGPSEPLNIEVLKRLLGL